MFRPKLIIFDEGHHSLADSWIEFKRQFQYGHDWKYILLTATPVRGDGLRYSLEQPGKPRDFFFYLFERKRAYDPSEYYIKQTTYRRISVPDKLIRSSNDVLDMLPRDYSNEEYMRSLLVPAAEQLMDLRTKLQGEIPVKMLIHTRSNMDANVAVDFFNKLCKEKAWPLYAAAIHGGLNTRDLNKNKTAFKFPSNRRDADAFRKGTHNAYVVDVGVHSTMLGEGYDNPWISVSVFLAPPKSVPKLSQYHGRAIRTYNTNLYAHVELLRDNTLAKSHLKQAYLYYPSLTKVEEVITSYEKGEDQNLDLIFNPVPVPIYENENEEEPADHHD